MKRVFAILAALVLAFQLGTVRAVAQDLAPLTLGAGLGDHMVLQRGEPVVLHGTAAPNERLRLELGEATVRATADPTGRWRARFPSRDAGGPVALTIEGDGDRTLHASDILFGDVFLCSGQSNMAWPVSASTGAPWPGSGPDPLIRLLQVGHATAPVPAEALTGDVAWQVADTGSVPPFSGVCWHFALSLRQDPDVPLGLVNASWGGSRIEPWISAEGLDGLTAYDERLALLARYADDPRAALAEYGAGWEAWWADRNGNRPWADGADDALRWDAIPGQLDNWQTWGGDWTRLTGMVWYRSGFELDAERAGQDATLVLGPVDEVDVSWVNGGFVGARFGWGDVRRYPVPAQLLRPGANALVVNVFNGWGAGGLTGPAAEIRLEFEDGHSVPVDDAWRISRVADGHPAAPQPPWESVGGLTTVFNAMIAPLRGRALAGVLWYQGESNTGEGRSYAQLLERLTADWRRQFGQEGLPFLVMQLPAFGAPHTAPGPSGWAELRDAQRRVAANEPATGLVVTLDLGDTFDLHPPHKAEVGARAAQVYRALRGESEWPADGIQPLSAVLEDGVVVLRFAPGQAPLTPLGAAWAHGFELCDAGGEACRFVPGRVEADTVRLQAGSGPAALLRHCWADAPSCNLVGAGGWPVSSFELVVSR